MRPAAASLKPDGAEQIVMEPAAASLKLDRPVAGRPEARRGLIAALARFPPEIKASSTFDRQPVV